MTNLILSGHISSNNSSARSSQGQNYIHGGAVRFNCTTTDEARSPTLDYSSGQHHHKTVITPRPDAFSFSRSQTCAQCSIF